MPYDIRWDNCFVAGTLILTDEGEKPIEDIEVGDYVYAENEETGERGFKRVKRLFRNETNVVVTVTVNGDKIETTEGHPFYVVDVDGERDIVRFKGSDCENWVLAKDLKVGDVVKLANGSTSTIEAVEIVVLDEPVVTYNFEVEDWHSYFVGKDSVLVHNRSLPKNARTTNNFNEVSRHLNKHHGVDPNDASARLHRIKNQHGMGGADNLIFDYTGGVYDPTTSVRIGSLTY